MNSSEIRDLFVRFFAERGHRQIPSSSLIPPPEERSLLFTNAGMNQMKPYFMGLSAPPARRMTSVQKCFRTSDIEEVGDATHCTLFEMLGNFSVGDYFKPDAIAWAWELLTGPQPQGVGLAKDRMWATVFLDDDEAFDLWRQAGIPAERIVRFDESENYWFMIDGGAGPCGPNSEVYYDFGADQGCGQPDCEPPLHTPPRCDRFVELWNLVFMTLYQEEDGKTRRPLPQRNVDTGGGLERWMSAHLWQEGIDWQGRPHQWAQPPTLYDSDLFRPILARVAEVASLDYDSAGQDQQRAVRIVAEHARASTFLIADGVTPANDGRGYVLRRLIRRGTSFGQRLQQGQFLERTAEAVIDVMGGGYPNLVQQREFVLRTLRSEESRFATTLERGSHLLDGMLQYRQLYSPRMQDLVLDFDQHDYSVENVAAVLEQRGFVGHLENVSPDTQLGNELAATALSDRVTVLVEVKRRPNQSDQQLAIEQLRRWANELSAREVFLLSDTYGFPPELTSELAREAGLEVDVSGFTEELEEQRARSRAAARFEGDGERIQTYGELGLQPTEFLGYETTRAFATVQSILLDGRSVVRELTPDTGEGHRVELALTQSPFYPEGGGQVGDRGEIAWRGGRFLVEDTRAVGEGGVIAHIGRLERGTLATGDVVEARVNEDLRADTMRNHTGTHILHAALRNVLGSHVRQAGSLVAPDRLRFDFTHLEAMTPAQIRDVEALANKVVRENISVHVEHQTYEEAVESGALAFFGDKYADTVRVVGVCDPEAEKCFSRELCGGTHVHSSGEVGAIVITAETSIGAGLRRLEAVTGAAAVERLRAHEDTLARLSASLQAPSHEVESKVAALRDENDRLRRQLLTLERRLARDEAATLADSAVQVNGVSMMVARAGDVANADALREMGDGLKSSLGSAVILLGSVIGGRPSFVAMSTADVASRCPAGDVVRAAAQAAGGNGGGRPELAQGGGSDPSKLDAALAAGRTLIEERLQPHP